VTSTKHPAEESRELIGEALAAVQDDPLTQTSLSLLVSTLASAQSNLFEAAKYSADHPIAVKDMRKAMEFLARALQLLQDIGTRSKAVDLAADAVARSLATLYKVAQPPGIGRPASGVSRAEGLKHPAAAVAAQVAARRGFQGRGPGAAPPPTEEDLRCQTLQLQVESTLNMESETHFYTGLSGRIDEGGIFVATFDIKPINSKIAVSFTLPSGETIVTKGLVRWVREYNPDYPDAVPGMGLSFIQLRDADRRAIEQFLEKKAPILYDEE
jgi:Tfp pilus assembly protein PilZ